MRETYHPEIEKHASPETEIDLLIRKRENLRREMFLDKKLNYKKLERMLEIPENELSPYFKAMVERIFKETPALKEIEDTAGKDNLIKNFVGAKFPTEVQFGKKEELEKLEKEKKEELTREQQIPEEVIVVVRGTYNRKSQAVAIREIPTQKLMWFSLIFREIPEVIKTLDHELTHFWHDQAIKQKPISMKIKEGFRGFKDFLKQKFFLGYCLISP